MYVHRIITIMGLSKSHEFNLSQNKIASITKALGHPARIAIIETLIKKDACVCGELVEELPLSQSTISQHLKELKNAGIITGSIEGPSVCYCIDNTVWKETQQLLTEFFDNYSKTCC